MKRKFDIIVVGAGINGKVMSLAAAHQGFSVGLIDQKGLLKILFKNSMGGHTR